MNLTRIPSAHTRALICAPLLLFTARAQTQPPPAPRQPTHDARSSTLQVELPTPVPLVGGGRSDIQTLSFVTPDTNFERNLVKGAPFSAESVTEHVQTLGDGNRMVRKSTARLYRDSAGRTRREHNLTRPGMDNALAPDGEPPRLIIINDPVGNVSYTIETVTGIARRQLLPPGLMEARERAMGTTKFSVLMPTSAAHRRMAEGDNAPPPPQPQREKLEPQMIEGVMAEGTRTTLTIPAGEFDNEQPLLITHEEWYAPELQMIVLMKHNDPRFGVTEFHLTNITRGEPAAELFGPQGYKVVDNKALMRPRGDMPMPRGDAPTMRQPGVIKN